MKIGIGIDTGGTYTDAVVYDFNNKEILGTAKHLTTKDDLSIGILGAIDGLPTDIIKKAEIISLSTTLATNAAVENKGGRAKLIFFGGDAKVIDEVGDKYGLPSSDEIYIQESFTKFSGEMEKEPDWKLFKEELSNDYDYDGVAIVEMNSMKNGSFVEKKAKKIFQETHDIPVVCGHELFSVLNSLQRSSSTLLNARLFPIIKEFLEAIKKSLKMRDIDAKIVIVRSDGSLMSEEFAQVRPVETLLSGPAASTIGGTQSTNNPNSIIIDMGGTTTDIALVNDGKPVSVIGGISVGKWKTFVDGLYIKTFGLGGDSAIHYKKQDIYLEETRAVPLCVAADRYPSIVTDLKKLNEKKRKHTLFLYEFYMLTKDISESTRYSEEEKALCEALKERPLLISEAAKTIGKDIYTLDASNLIDDDVIQVCGLTPTDIMHIKKDFNKYSSKASLLGAEFVAFNLDITVEELCERVYKEVKRKIYINIVEVCLENKYPNYMKNGVSEEVVMFANESFEAASTGEIDDLLNVQFKTNYSLVGLGAPINIFLDDVARMLGTEAIIPKHYEVANALGSVVGNISSTYSIIIKPLITTGGIEGFTVFGYNETKDFETVEEAEEYAIIQAQEAARAEAISRGANGEITTDYSLKQKIAESKETTVYLGSIITAKAEGGIW